MGREFERLDAAVCLCLAGRVNAAASEWFALPEVFRIKVLQFVRFVFEHPEFHDATLNVVIETSFGDWRMTDERIRNTAKAVKELCCAKHS